MCVIDEESIFIFEGRQFGAGERIDRGKELLIYIEFDRGCADRQAAAALDNGITVKVGTHHESSRCTHERGMPAHAQVGTRSERRRNGVVDVILTDRAGRFPHQLRYIVQHDNTALPCMLIIAA